MFISVKEAADLTGKSSTTIYRLCNKRINTLYVRKEDNKFLIDKEFLLATYPPVEDYTAIKETEEKTSATANQNSNTDEQVKTIELNKPPVVIERVSENINGSTPSDLTNSETIEKGTTLEFENEMPKKFMSNLFSWETIIGLSASLILIAVFIYLITVFTK